MSNDIKKSKVTWVKNKPYDQWLYDNDIAMQDKQAKQVMQRNSSSLTSKDIRDNPWLSEDDFR